jgi:hypothetical protein
VISRVQCFLTGTALFFGALSAFANSTAFNGYVQSSGANTGIDLSSIDSGSYRVTITRGGQLNFRYVVGGQTFDSNPEAAILDMVSNSDAAWSDTWTPSAYSASVQQDPVIGSTPLSNYAPGFEFFNPGSQAALVNQAATSGNDDLEAARSRYDHATYSEGVNGTNFYTPSSQAPEAYTIPGTSMIALVNNSNSNMFYSNQDWWVGVQEEVPEPATLTLIAGAILLFVTRASWPALTAWRKARLLR